LLCHHCHQATSFCPLAHSITATLADLPPTLCPLRRLPADEPGAHGYKPAQDDKDRSVDYNHSTFADLIIEGLIVSGRALRVHHGVRRVT
jgi:hypothetical protein